LAKFRAHTDNRDDGNSKFKIQNSKGAGRRGVLNLSHFEFLILNFELWRAAPNGVPAPRVSGRRRGEMFFEVLRMRLLGAWQTLTRWPG
jgi:hypothetical protein